jgi:ubiquinone/menaquinone biosynthesis C-methylase UbiE
MSLTPVKKPVRWTVLMAMAATMAVAVSAQGARRNVWEARYRERSAESMAAEFEEPSRAVFRYRVAMAGLLRLKPGMTVAEIGAGSGFLSRTLAAQVGPTGHVYATELEDKMVAYMRERAKRDGLSNFTAVRGQVAATGLGTASVDAVAVVNAYSFFDQPAEMLGSIAHALRPGGLLLIVDIPQTGSGADSTGVEAEDVIAAARAAGFTMVDESSVVPGHYALRFRR